MPAAPTPSSHQRLVIGVMTGTSIDGIDAAAVRITGHGLLATTTFAHAVSLSLDDSSASSPAGPLTTRLRRIAEQDPMTAAAMAAASRDLSAVYAAAIARLIMELKLAPSDIAFISAHGQTVLHAPPVSWQMLTPALIAARLGIPVVSDLRAADLAAGGQGAPITPIADWLLLRNYAESRAIVNLGGFCNQTVLPAAGNSDSIRGGDVCACNHLLDTVARRCLGAPYDHNGAAALTGTVNDDALDDLRAILLVQASSKRSLGTGDEVMGWIGRYRAAVSGPDLAATACEAIAEMIAKAVASGGGGATLLEGAAGAGGATETVDRVLLAGGGLKNAALVRAIGSCCSAKVQPTDALGVPGAYREAIAMAVLGALCADGVPITLTAVTGTPNPPVAGTWVFPAGPRDVSRIHARSDS